jgi:MFS transporter, MHS family, shikimate and dehydroshikimate transport protein
MASAARLGGQREGESRSLKSVIAASFIGTTIEWYDFFLYGTAAALVFDKLFFPEATPLVGTLLAFSTYAVGFAARPLGGIVFGHFGDRVGRKSMLVLSLLIMGTATFLIGCMPTYGSIGVLAPILLVVLRFAQGIGVGGEWGGAVLMSTEYAPKERRGFFGSWPQMGVPAGLLLSTVVFKIVEGSMSESAFNSWGWRVPFLVSAILVIIGLVIRLRIMESPAFERIKETKTEAKKPIVDVVRKYPREVLTAMGMRVAENGAFYVLTVFTLAYGEKELGLSKDTMLNAVIISAAIGLVTVPLWGGLSDRFGRKPLYLAGAVVTTLWAFPLFGLMNTASPALIVLGIVIGVNVGHDLMYGPQAAYYAELFGTRVRYSGASLGYQLASVFAGGFAPLIATALLAAGGWELVALYVVVMGLITVVSTLLAPETLGTDFDRDDEAELELVREKRFDRARFADRETVETR